MGAGADVYSEDSGTEYLRLACLAPSDAFDYTQIFESQFQERSGKNIEMERYHPHRGELPDTYEFDGIVVSGSRFHVYDHQDWELELEQYLEQVLEQDVPVLGVCYGHQVVSTVLGGTVDSLETTEELPFGELPVENREMGYREVELTNAGKSGQLFAEMDDSFLVFQSHQDSVVELPPDTEPLAANEYGVQAIKSTKYPAYGVQFHPEYDLEMAKQLLENKDMDEQTYNAIVATLTEEHDLNARASRKTFDNFLEQL